MAYITSWAAFFTLIYFTLFQLEMGVNVILGERKMNRLITLFCELSFVFEFEITLCYWAMIFPTESE